MAFTVYEITFEAQGDALSECDKIVWKMCRFVRTMCYNFSIRFTAVAFAKIHLDIFLYKFKNVLTNGIFLRKMSLSCCYFVHCICL